VAEIENEGSAAQGGQDALRLGVYCRTARYQDLIVQVALHAPSQTGLNHVGTPGERDGAVQAEAVNRSRLNVAVVLQTGAARKGDDRGSRVFRAKGFDDGGDGAHTPEFEEGIGKNARPTFEKLYGFGAGLNLPFQELRDGLGQQVDQRLKIFWIARGPLLNRGMVRGTAASALDHVHVVTMKRNSQGLRIGVSRDLLITTL
jgi:hypothetical protein